MFAEHNSECDLLLYCLGLIRNEDEVAPIEEHLLWCQECLDRFGAFRNSATLKDMEFKRELCWVASPLVVFALTAAEASQPFDYDQPHLHGTEYSIPETHPALSFCGYSVTASPAVGDLAFMVSPPTEAVLATSAPWNQASWPTKY